MYATEKRFNLHHPRHQSEVTLPRILDFIARQLLQLETSDCADSATMRHDIHTQSRPDTYKYTQKDVLIAVLDYGSMGVPRVSRTEIETDK